MPPSPRDSSDRSPAPPPFPRPSAPSSIGCINASSTTSINSFTPWASRSPHESRPEHRTSQREQNPRYPPHNGLHPLLGVEELLVLLEREAVGHAGDVVRDGARDRLALLARAPGPRGRACPT